MAYVDGYVVSVPLAELAAGRARTAAGVNAKVMADPFLANMPMEAMLFDGKRMFWGGFKPMVSLVR